MKCLKIINNIYIWLCNLKRYIAFNFISLLGYLDFLFCIYFFVTLTGPSRFSAGDIMLILSCYYAFFTRIALFIFLVLFTIEKSTKFKLARNKFIDNRIYNIFFLFGLFVCSVFTVIVIYPLFIIIYTILFIHKI